jgi:hypothetical protein
VTAGGSAVREQDGIHDGPRARPAPSKVQPLCEAHVLSAASLPAQQPPALNRQPPLCRRGRLLKRPSAGDDLSLRRITVVRALRTAEGFEHTAQYNKAWAA